jgi:ATP-dependent helicase/nuclease subunit A
MQWTPEQTTAIETMDKSLVIRATAGSGKTQVLIEKVIKIHQEKGIPLEHIVVVTFTEKAAWELKERLAKKLERPLSELSQLPIGTFHALAFKILQEKGAVLDETSSHLERLQSTQDTLITSLRNKEPASLLLTETYGFATTIQTLSQALDHRHTLLPLIAQHNDLADPLTQAFLECLQQVGTLYDKRKEQLELMDFDDLEQKSIALLQDKSQQDHYQKLFRYIFVDEFQDVNPTQIKLLELLYNPQHNHLIIVGDPLQSIYRFRGSDASLFAIMEARILEHRGESLSLTTNFRSEADLIHPINQFFTNLMPDHYRPMVAKDAQESLFSSGLDVLLIQEKMSADQRRQWEASQVVARLKEWHEQGDGEKNWGKNWKDMAILFRSRAAMGHYKTALTAANIPFRPQNETSLLERQEVLDSLQFLRVLANPQDNIAWLGLYRSPLFQLSLDDLWTQQKTLFQPEKSCPSWMADLIKNKDLYLPSELIRILMDWIEEHDLYPHPQQRANLNKWHHIALTLERLRPLTLNDFLMNIASLKGEKGLLGEASLAATDDEGISLLTIHSAKGLEFPIVVLADLQFHRVGGLKPFVWHRDLGLALKTSDTSSQGLKNDWIKSKRYEEIEKENQLQDLEESKRLLYVGCTRAIKKLILPLDISRNIKKQSTSWNDWLVKAFAS